MRPSLCGWITLACICLLTMSVVSCFIPPRQPLLGAFNLAILWVLGYQMLRYDFLWVRR